MATLEPKIQKSTPAVGNPNQPEPRIIENPPASTLVQALANGKAQVDASRNN